MKISFDATPEERQIIQQLAERAQRLERRPGRRARPRVDWAMDFTACHANGNPLRLADLLAADDFNFMHDAFGICRHLDRDSGQLRDFFTPRFSKREESAA